MANLTPWEIAFITIGGILAFCGAVSTIAGAVEKFVKMWRAAKAPEQKQNAEIEKINERLTKIEEQLKREDQKIADSQQCNHVLTEGMLALLEHGINGNNVKQMREAKQGIEAYLIHH